MTSDNPDTTPQLFASDTADNSVPTSDEQLIAAYVALDRTLDDLPYTPEFDQLLQRLGTTDRPREALHRLLTIRKRGDLPQLSKMPGKKRGKAPSKPPAITDDERRTLRTLADDITGGLGKRDRLPYTDDFERLVSAFNAATGRSLDPHDVWRIVATLAK